MHVFLDISRLLQVSAHATPTGIDRVELAYARHFGTAAQGRCTFVAEIPLIGFAALPFDLVRELVSALTEVWSSGEPAPARRIAAKLRLSMPMGRARLGSALARPGPKVLLVASHRVLERPRHIGAMRRRGCLFVPFIHDLIPLNHPEFARPGHAARHEKRITTTAQYSDAIVVNSAATAAELAPWLSGRLDSPPVAIAPLGVSPARVPQPPVALRPYFVVLGTIEPRKNHILLLHIWRQLGASLGSQAPRLVVVGKRGWENENVLDLLERCRDFDGTVQEAGCLPDHEVASLLRGARALLFPSFAEGYGLPVAEALGLGVPVLASDIAALREVAGGVPEYLDPVDGVAWRNAILDYARPDSAARRAQLARIQAWTPPSWDDHFEVVEETLRTLTGRPGVPLAPAVQRPRRRAPVLVGHAGDGGA